MNKKSAFTTFVNLTLISIISGSILTTSLFMSQSNKEKANMHAEQISKYMYAIRARVSTSDGKAVSNNSATNGFNAGEEKQQVGTIWPSIETDGIETCVGSSCGSWFTGSSGGVKVGTLTSIRHLIVPISTTCKYYESEKYSWYSDKHISNVLPCNYYRMSGPLSTDLYSDHEDSNKKNATPVAIKFSHQPNEQQQKIGINDTYTIDSVDMFVPVSILTHSKTPLTALNFTNRLEQLIGGYVSISIVKLPISGSEKTDKITKIMNATSPSYGVSAATLLSSECTDKASSENCFVRISYNNAQSPTLGSGDSGCRGKDCLKTDGSNSMTATITYKDKDDKDIENVALLAWKIKPGLKREDAEQPSIDEVESGIVAKNNGSKLEFKLRNGIPLELEHNGSTDTTIKVNPTKIVATVDGVENLTLTKDNVDIAANKNLRASVNETIGLSVASNSVLDAGLLNNRPRVAIVGKLEPANNRSIKGITITSGDYHPALSIGDHDDLGVEISEKGYYLIASIGDGMLDISGILSSSGEKSSVDISMTNNLITGTVMGDVGPNANILMTKNNNAYLYLGTGSAANLNIKVVGAATLLLTKEAKPTIDSTNYEFSLDPARNETLATKKQSNVLRLSSEGIVESDNQRFRISKKLEDFPIYPGDCAYTNDALDCPSKAKEFVEFLKEVPNIEKTIDLIKKYTPNKYIAWKSDWEPIKSMSDQTASYPDSNMYKTFHNMKFKNDAGIEESFRTLPERVRVVIRSDKDKCTVPAALADDEGYFYQEAHPSQPTDDDVRDATAGAVYSFNKKGVQVYAPTQNNGSNHRYLFYTYDGWGNEAARFHCDYGHVQVTVYRPETIKTQIQTISPDTVLPRVYDSGWIAVSKNKDYGPYNHNLGVTPSKATVWQASNSSGANMMVSDAIYSGGGFGTWVQNITASEYSLSTGPLSAMSGYGRTNHWSFDNGSGYIRVVLEE